MATVSANTNQRGEQRQARAIVASIRLTVINNFVRAKITHMRSESVQPPAFGSTVVLDKSCMIRCNLCSSQCWVRTCVCVCVCRACTWSCESHSDECGQCHDVCHTNDDADNADGTESRQFRERIEKWRPSGWCWIEIAYNAIRWMELAPCAWRLQLHLYQFEWFGLSRHCWRCC